MYGEEDTHMVTMHDGIRDAQDSSAPYFGLLHTLFESVARCIILYCCVVVPITDQHTYAMSNFHTAYSLY